MHDPLDFIWPLLDHPEPTVTNATVEKWPAGFQQRLLDWGFLAPAEDADRVLCPECHDHEEEVVSRTGRDKKTRFFIPCPQLLRTEVLATSLRRWQVVPQAIAGALAKTLDLKGRCTELLPGRLWRMGRTTWQGSSRDVFFARGLGWDDVSATRALIVQGTKPIVFSTMCRPPDTFWQRKVHPVLVLFQLAMLTEQGIEVERMEIAAAIQAADLTASESDSLILTTDQLALKIRQQIKAERRTELTDEVFLAAYRQENNLRSAAAFLTEQTGQEISKDKVKRALDRAGGAAAVLDGTDSNSVIRGVASRRRDKRGKTLINSKPKQQQ